MSITFSADEIFEMAEELERNGGKFYRQAAENFKDPVKEQLLLSLAEMEDQHEITFHEMRGQLTDAEKEIATYDPDHEAAMYLRAMADGHVFDVTQPPSEKLTGNESFVDILKIAIGCEKDSIVFYLGLRDLVSAKDGKDKIDAIIREEMGHISILNKQLMANL
ncbi:MAG: ferritin family protein [Planctomycetes bacterium]|nr:ferritin family protein [Planctomycetota bacterium]